jgi:hypothetical protein
MAVERSRLACDAAQLAALVRVHGGHALGPALERALPIYLAIFLVGRAVVVLPDAQRSLLGAGDPALVAMAAAWLLLSTPARWALVSSAATRYLRCLPLATAAVSALLVGSLLILDLPWIWLCAARGGPAAALLGAALTLAGHAALLGGELRHRLLLLALLAAAAVAPAWATIAASGCLGAIALSAARMAELPQHRWRAPALFLAHPVAGLLQAYLISLGRSARGLVTRAWIVLAVGVAAAALAIANNDITALRAAATVELIVVLVPAAATLPRVASHVLDSGRQVEWLVATTAVGRGDRIAAGGLAMAIAGGVLGAIHALAVAIVAAPQHLGWLVAMAMTWGALVALMVLGVVAWASRRGEPDPNRILAGTLALTIVLAFLVGGGLGLAGLIAPAAAAAAIVVYGRQVATAMVSP